MPRIKPRPTLRANKLVASDDPARVRVAQKQRSPAVLDTEWEAERAAIMQGRPGAPLRNALRLGVFATLGSYLLIFGLLFVLERASGSPSAGSLITLLAPMGLVGSLFALFFLSNALAEHRREKQYTAAYARYQGERARLWAAYGKKAAPLTPNPSNRLATPNPARGKWRAAVRGR